jgi:cytochrome c2
MRRNASMGFARALLTFLVGIPSADVHRTKMVISVPNAEIRHNIIAYLETLKS